MQLIRRRRLEVVFAAVLTRHGITDLVHGAQVENKNMLLFEHLAAELANQLSEQNRIELAECTDISDVV